MKSVLILGIGNYLRRDDGFGIHFLRYLEEKNAFPLCTLVDTGTYIAQNFDLLCSHEVIICLDAISAQEEIGKVHCYNLEEVTLERSYFHNMHKIDIFEAIQMVEEVTKEKPEVYLLGVEPKSFDWGMVLSKEVERSFEKVYTMLQNIIKQYQ